MKRFHIIEVHRMDSQDKHEAFSQQFPFWRKGWKRFAKDLSGHYLMPNDLNILKNHDPYLGRRE